MTTYDPASYWRQRGETYEAKFRPERYASQEAAIRDVLEPLIFGTVLEVGCGFGRIGAIVADLRPRARYTGLDLSPVMLASAARRMPKARLLESSIDDFPTGGTWDLVVAVEVLMHVPPHDVGRALRKLVRLSSRYLLTVDWTEPVARPAQHNFCHDYDLLLADSLMSSDRVDRRRVGLQTLHLIEKVRA